MSVENMQVVEEESGTEGSEGSTSGSAGGAAALGRSPSRVKKKGRRIVNDVIIHVYASFNNTLITVTDVKGNVLSWATAGGCGFRGSRKSTPFAAQVAAGKAVQKAIELYDAKTGEVWLYGPGPGREASARAARDCGIKVTAIFDITPVPFNGVRAPKPRRV